MQRSFSIHPGSLLAGVLLTGLALLSMSQTPVLNARTVNVQYLPDPRDYVQIKFGFPYTVPAGKILVVTALGNTDGSGSFNSLKVDGVPELTAIHGYPQNPPSIAPVATGFSIPAGSVVEVDSTSTARAWGYLAPQ